MFSAPELTQSRIVWDTQRSDSQEVLSWETWKKSTTVLTESIKIQSHTDGHDPSLFFRLDWPKADCERFGKICWGMYIRCKMLVDGLHRKRTETACSLWVGSTDRKSYRVRLGRKHTTVFTETQVSYDPRSYERNLCNCVYRSLTLFHIRSSIYETFHILLYIHSSQAH